MSAQVSQPRIGDTVRHVGSTARGAVVDFGVRRGARCAKVRWADGSTGFHSFQMLEVLTAEGRTDLSR